MKAYINRMNPQEVSAAENALRERWNWYFSLGIALITLGILAIGAATLTTVVSVIICGALLLAGCIATVMHATQFWQKNWSQFFLHLVVGILYGIAGALLIFNPMLGALSLTFFLSILYLLLGVSRIVIALSTRPLSGWRWVLINGIISLAIGITVFLNWPAISFWVIGLFVGIDLIFIGCWLALLGWMAHS